MHGPRQPVAWTGPRAKPDLPWPRTASVLDPAAAADLLILALAAGPETDGMVDEPVLIDALRHGTTAVAGLDVFTKEPRLDPRSPNSATSCWRRTVPR